MRFIVRYVVKWKCALCMCVCVPLCMPRMFRQFNKQANGKHRFFTCDKALSLALSLFSWILQSTDRWKCELSYFATSHSPTMLNRHMLRSYRFAMLNGKCFRNKLVSLVFMCQTVEKNSISTENSACIFYSFFRAKQFRLYFQLFFFK